jgi:aminomethyltransferase
LSDKITIESTPKRTALYEKHVELGGKIVDFAGWSLPVFYSGIIAEHEAVRNKAGLFDVSHMGEISVTGPEASLAIEDLTCNKISSLYPGKAVYNALINQSGGVVDDIIVYKIRDDNFLICINASNTEKDFSWMLKHNKRNATIVNESSKYGQLALQGPMAERILSKLFPKNNLKELKYFHFIDIEFSNDNIIVARTGYTGEDGFEIFVPWNKTTQLWDDLLERGKEFGLLPCGLGARDSLRLEACYPLYGHELKDDISAIESGLAWIVKLDKGSFMGRDVIEKHKKEGAPRSLIAFFVEEHGIAREGCKIFLDDNKEIGYVTSGTKTPTIQRALGMALVESSYARIGQKIFFDIRGKKVSGVIVEKPFYRRKV